MSSKTMTTVTEPKLTREQLQAQVNALRNELKAMGRSVSFKITAKGGLSMYGFGRFPVTLYKGQWDFMLANIEALREFLEANRDKLKDKE